MTTNEQNLILDLCSKAVTQDQFLRFFRNSTDGQKLTLALLGEALASKDPDAVEFALLVGFTFGFSVQHLPVLIQLAEAPWHYKHEDVVSALDRLRSPESIDTLYHATQQLHSYLDYDEARALAVKAIWALGNIGNSQAIEKLKLLSTSAHPILRENALNQLQRLRLGIVPD